MALTAEEYREYIDLAHGLSLELEKESNDIATMIVRWLAVHIEVIESSRLPMMTRHREALRRHNEHEKANDVTVAMEHLMNDVRRSRLALKALEGDIP